MEIKIISSKLFLYLSFKIDLIVWKFAEFVECAIFDNSLK